MTVLSADQLLMMNIPPTGLLSNSSGPSCPQVSSSCKYMHSHKIMELYMQEETTFNKYISWFTRL